MHTHRHPLRSLLVAALLLTGTAACGASDDDGAPTADTDAATATTATAAGASGDDPGPGSAPTGLVALDAAGICAAAPADLLARVLELPIGEAEPADLATPQCSYPYETDDGTSSNVTVASMRPDEDLGGRDGDEAFDWVVELNTGIAPGVTATPVTAGDRAVRITGPDLHYGLLAAGGSLLTVVLPADHVSASRVDDLLVAIAAELG